MSQFKTSRKQLSTRTALDAIRQVGRKRNSAALVAGALALGAARVATAQIPIQYLENLDGSNFQNTTPTTTLLPYSATPAPDGQLGPENFYLPNYGRVQVTLTPTNFDPTIDNLDGTFGSYTGVLNNNAKFQNQNDAPPVGLAPTYSWGTDTNNIGINYLNRITTQSGADEEYTLSFNFVGPSAANVSDLILVVTGLANGTTATVTTTTTDSTIDTPYLVGEDRTPPSGPVPAPTVLTGSQFSSGYNTSQGTDNFNTGWALAQFRGSGDITSLELSVDQIPGDGIGFTVAYVPEPASTGLLCFAAFGLLRRRVRRQQPCPASSS
jgi:hypothetical protein